MTHVPGPSKSAERPLDVRGTRHDVCPDCGREREELLIAPDLFYCPHCEKSTLGPNTVAPEVVPEQEGLFDVQDMTPEYDGPPPDEGMAWVGEEGPDE